MNKSQRAAVVRMNVAGYHGDQGARVRLMVESRVNRAVMQQAWRDGARSREAGAKCTCQECIQRSES